MDYLKRSDIIKKNLPGRVIQNAVGKKEANPIPTEKMTVLFAHYDAENGPMEPHNHAEETVVILAADKGFIKWGSAKDTLEHTQTLAAGDVLHFPALEWHAFAYEGRGYVDALCIYGEIV
jgi:uncharacterized RmlC-like cupin family protein